MVFVGAAVVHLRLIVHHLQVPWLQPELQLDAVGHLPEGLQGRQLGLREGRHPCITAGDGCQLVVSVIEGDGEVALEVRGGMVKQQVQARVDTSD